MSCDNLGERVEACGFFSEDVFSFYRLVSEVLITDNLFKGQGIHGLNYKVCSYFGYLNKGI